MAQGACGTLRVCAVAGLVMLGCAPVEGEVAPEEVGEARARVVGGELDDGTPQPWPLPPVEVRNAVVYLPDGRCTGFLISPELVVTAAHCMLGVALGGIKFGSMVHVGPNGDAPVTTSKVTAIKYQSPFDGTPGTEDLALLRISPAILEEAWAQRPTFSTDALRPELNQPAFVTGFGATSHSGPPGPDDLPDVPIRSFSEVDLGLYLLGAEAGEDWNWIRQYRDLDQPSNYPQGLLPIDSGGPLLWASDGNLDSYHLDVLGIASMLDFDCGPFELNCDGNVVWSSLMVPWGTHEMWVHADNGRGKLDEYGQIEEVGPLLGERDYIGPCQEDIDPDCDRYIDGADVDGDGVLNRIDNCPGARNPLQENCNFHAETRFFQEGRVDTDGYGPRDWLGDACDPAPCLEASAVDQTLYAPFASGLCSQLDNLLGTCNVSVETAIEWSPAAGKAVQGRQGDAYFLHCLCNGPHETPDQITLNCRLAQSFSNCPIGTRIMQSLGTTAGDWKHITTYQRQARSAGTEPYRSDAASA